MKLSARTFSALALVSAVVAGCGGDSNDGLAEVAASAVPSGEPETVEGIISFDDGCIRTGDTVLVFVEGAATLEEAPATPESGPVQVLQWRGGGRQTMAGFDDHLVTVSGHLVDPDDWVTEPPSGCEGPYFLTTVLGIVPG